MNKRVLALAASAMAVGILLVGCGGGGTDATTAATTTEQTTTTVAEAKVNGLDGITTYFTEKGYTVGAKTEKSPEMIGAQAGFGTTLNGVPVEFYQFAEGSDALKQAQSTGKVTVQGFGTEMNIIMNGNIGLIFSNEGSNEQIEADFKAIKFQ